MAIQSIKVKVKLVMGLPKIRTSVKGWKNQNIGEKKQSVAGSRQIYSNE
jgi:hypothetical protein